MRIAVEEAVAEDHRHPRLRHQVGDVAPLLERPPLRVEVRDLRPVDPLERQHAAAGVAPEDPRDAHVGMSREVAVEGVRVACLEAVVELLPDRAGELVDELMGVDEVEGADTLLGDSRRLVEQGEVRLDLARRAGPLHLHRDPSSVRQRRAMHLADRRSGDGPWVEFEEELVDGEPKVLVDHVLDVAEREGTDVVLECAELRDDVGRQDVRACRQQLAELDERRAELVEHLPQVLAALRRLPVQLDARPAAREELGQLVLVEPVAEAVADRDLRDLGETAEVSGGRLRHRVSVARRGAFSWASSRLLQGIEG